MLSREVVRILLVYKMTMSISTGMSVSSAQHSAGIDVVLIEPKAVLSVTVDYSDAFNGVVPRSDRR